MKVTTIKRVFNTKSGLVSVKIDKEDKENLITNGSILIKNYPHQDEILNALGLQGAGEYSAFHSTDFKEQRFPDYKKVIPEKDTERYPVNTIEATDILIEKPILQRVLKVVETGEIAVIDENYFKLIEELTPCSIEDFKISQNRTMIAFGLEENFFIICMLMNNYSAVEELIERVSSKSESDGPAEEPEQNFNDSEEESIDDLPPSLQGSGEEIEKDKEQWEDTKTPIEDIKSPAFPESEETEAIEEPVEEQSTGKEVSKQEASELYQLIKARKPYRNFDLSKKLIGVLLEKDIDNIDEIKTIQDTGNPATYKQNKALNRIIFGRYYSKDTMNQLLNVLN